jgi:hypothetical protein
LCQPAIGIVDRAQQFIERRRIFDGPSAVERWTQQVQLAPGKQTDGHDAF